MKNIIYLAAQLLIRLSIKISAEPLTDVCVEFANARDRETQIIVRINGREFRRTTVDDEKTHAVLNGASGSEIRYDFVATGKFALFTYPMDCRNSPESYFGLGGQTK